MQKTSKCALGFPQSFRVSSRFLHRRLPEQAIRHILEHAVTHAFNITTSEFWSLTRRPPRIALARQVGMYLAHVTFEMTLTEVGQVFARDRTTVAHACSVIEDRRDDASFDHALDLLERAVQHLRPSAGPKVASGLRRAGAAPA